MNSTKTKWLIPNYRELSALISISANNSNLPLGKSLHGTLLKSSFPNPAISRNALAAHNALISLYSKCGTLTDALKVFDKMPQRDIVSYNTLIGGYLRSQEIETGFSLFRIMLQTAQFDHASLTTVLTGVRNDNVGRLVHGVAAKTGFESDIVVGNALVSFYFRCGSVRDGKRVFEEMVKGGRNVISWTAVISGLAQNGVFEESFRLFVELRKGKGCEGFVRANLLTYLSSLTACSGLKALKEGMQVHGVVLKEGMGSDLCVESALMDMYSKCASVDDAWRIFEDVEEFDEVSLTVILVGFAQNGFVEEAIQIFVKMVKGGICVDSNMVSAVLGVDTSLGFGKQIHSLVIKRGFNSNVFVSNGLINMYSKCGELDESGKVFDGMQERNSISYNSMIAAFARHGDGLRALGIYDDMRLQGVEPTDVTFLSLLHACSHVGLVREGMEFLNSMTKEHGLWPRMEHYACVVDMLGRAGLLNEARLFVEELPEKPGILVWQALLGACSISGNAELGKYAADQLLQEAPESAGPYVLLSNIYSSEGRWKERAKTIKRMKEAGVAKETGISWIEIEKKVHSFVVDDKMHPQSELVHEVLLELFRPMIDEGYVPDKRFILHYLGEHGNTSSEDLLYDKCS